MESDINKLYAILTYGYTVDKESPFYKNHSLVIPTAASIKLRDALYLGIETKHIPACAFLICSLLPESSSWNLIHEYDPNNTYHVKYMNKDMAGLAKMINIDKALTLLPPDVRLASFASNWIDLLGAISLEILQGAI